MTAQERALVLVTARALRAAASLDWLSTGLTLVSAAAILFDTPSVVFPAIAIILGAIAKFYAVRIAFDARLLEDLAAETISTPQLDDALAVLVDKAPSDRSWPDRCRGARRLVMLCGVATIAQLCAVLATAVTHLFW
ncbi:MAG: hypothetical protein ACYC7A_02860 [Thermoanaerobaculia bacterium]